MRPVEPFRRPVSTYRLQFHGGFRFADGADLVPYLARLGITECYSSPPLKANPGSSHGYDIGDHSQINPELGGESDYQRFCEALRAHDLGHIVDFVPNHMACDARSNPWWHDVLENGPSSPYAHFFDVDWTPVKPELRGKVLLPVLGDQYGRVLERGELQLRFDQGALHLWYFDRYFPINPRQSPRLLELNLDRLEQELDADPALREYQSILTALHNLPPYLEQDPARIVERQREKEVARERLVRLVESSLPIRRHIDECVRIANGKPGDPRSFDHLHELLEAQAYRLAYWRTAFDEINYRRFFDVNDLIGLRVEEPHVFDATHTMLRRLIARRWVTGVRVDHPDGLYDPQEYFDRLQRLAREALDNGTDPGRAEGSLYVVAEKILSAGESLRSDWQVHGTTGYGFLNTISGVFVDTRHVPRLRRIYARLTGRQETFAEVAYWSKRTIMLTAMASDLNLLAHALNLISERDRRCRDFTLDSCRKGLREVIACFPVYRTYVSERGADMFDRRAVEAAVGEARRRNPVMEASIFEFVKSMLLPPVDAAASGDGEIDRDRLRFAMKMQQFTGPVQAKGVEDTAFYRYHVLVSANDVGGSPGRLGLSPSEFHDANRTRLACWPLEMIATSTHDTKRGEDARARLNALSEVPDEWRRALSEWMRINARHRVKLRGNWAPDRNDEYLFYQALVGAWPAEAAAAPVPRAAPSGLVDRIRAYMQKAVREAKVHTSWIDEDQAYGHAVARFVERSLAGDTAERFLRSFVPFQRRLASVGTLNSLSQLVLKLASPGVPDFYQGIELWDLSLVDPDNRRPVDFARRRELLDELEPVVRGVEAGEPVVDEVRRLLAQCEDGRIKLFVTACGLRFRRAHADLMHQGAYVPLEPDGPSAGHLVAFARQHASGSLVAIVPRLVAPLVNRTAPMPLGDGVWSSTRIPLAEALPAGPYRHLLTGEAVDSTTDGGRCWLAAARVFQTSPVALLWASR